MFIEKVELEKIQAYFRDKPVKKAYLFGSFARGEAEKESDIDILVELDYQMPIGLLFVEMKIDLEEILQRKVDLVSIKGFSKYILPTVEQEKKMIYAG
jgi:hypothetical protein